MEQEAKYLVAMPTPATLMQTVQVIQTLAPVMAASRMFGVTAEQAAVVMLKGHELGLGLATAFEFIHVVEGKPGISPKGMMAMIHRSHDVDVTLERLELGPGGEFNGYRCRMTRRSTGITHTATFTLEDAKRAGLVKPRSAWECYPENLCMWRAIGFAADVVCPDLGGGMYRPEELGAVVDQDGEVVESTAVEAPNPVSVETKPTDFTWTLQALVAKFGAQAVMAANGGRIPASDSELATIATKLTEAANAA